jgi:hypothetical protein
MICTNCGNEVPDTAKVCGYCGHRLKEVSQPTPAPIPIPMPVTAPPKTTKTKTPGWVWGLIGSLVLLGILTAGGFFLLDRFRTGITNPVRLPAAPTQSSLQPTAAVVPPADQPVDSAIPIPEPRVKLIHVYPYQDGDTAKSIKDYATETGSNSWSVNITSDTPVMLNWSWCAATQAILNQNLEAMRIRFYVDGKDVTDSMTEMPGIIEGGVCHNFRGIIRTWPVGNHRIIYKMIFLETVNDGESDYSGENNKTYVINVTQ